MDIDITMKRTEKQVLDLYLEFKHYQSTLDAYLTKVLEAIDGYNGKVDEELQFFINERVDDKDFSVKLVDLTKLVDMWRFVVECRKTSQYKRAHDYNPRNLMHTFVVPDEEGKVEGKRTHLDIAYYNLKTAEELDRLKDAYENYQKYERLVRETAEAVGKYNKEMNPAVCPVVGFL